MTTEDLLAAMVDKGVVSLTKGPAGYVCRWEMPRDNGHAAVEETPSTIEAAVRAAHACAIRIAFVDPPAH